MFLSSGIDHLLSTEGQRGNDDDDGRNDDDSSDGSDGNGVYSDSLFTGTKGQPTSATANGQGTRASGQETRASGQGKSLLPQGTLAKMRDLMESTDKVASMLRTGKAFMETTTTTTKIPPPPPLQQQHPQPQLQHTLLSHVHYT